MTESFWIKKLADGTSEQGTDSAIDRGLSSWTRGRQDIEEVILFFGGTTVSIFCPLLDGKQREWALLDHNVFSLTQGASSRYAREVRCLPSPFRTFDISAVGSSCTISFGNLGRYNIPDGKEWFTCTIRQNGSIIIRWE